MIAHPPRKIIKRVPDSLSGPSRLVKNAPVSVCERRQYILDVDEAGMLHEVRNFLTREGLYDCSWSEVNEGQLVSASADGSIKLWDLSTSESCDRLISPGS
jgi:WD40 repeat protein